MSDTKEPNEISSESPELANSESADEKKPSEPMNLPVTDKNIFSWPKAVTWIVVILTIGALVGMYLVLNNARQILKPAVSTKHVKARFDSYVVGLRSRNSLQVALLNTQEEFVLTSEKKLLTYLPGGTVEVAARVPCEIIYNIALKDAKWLFMVTDNGRRLSVVAPEIEFNRPAVDLARYDLRVVKYSYIRDEEEALQLLQSQIPEKLDEIGEKNIDSVKDTARISVKDFVEGWLLASFDGKKQELPVVDRVFFADEEDKYRHLQFTQNVETSTTEEP